MASIISRPAPIVSVGGSIVNNEIIYRLSSSLNFEILEIFNADTNTLLFTVRASVVNGEAFFDISANLRALFANYLFNQFLRVYAKGAGFNDNTNIVNVVNASQNRLNSDFTSFANIISIAPNFKLLNKMPIYKFKDKASISFMYRQTTDFNINLRQGSTDVVTIGSNFGLERGIVTANFDNVFFRYSATTPQNTNKIPIIESEDCTNFILGWVNANNGVDILGFKDFEERYEVVQSSDFFPYGIYQRRTIQKQKQKNVTLYKVVTNEELEALQDLLTSNLVVKFNADLVTYIEMQVTSSNIKNLTSNSNLHEIEINLAYPIEN